MIFILNKTKWIFQLHLPQVVSMSVSHAVGCEFVPQLGHSKDHHKMLKTAFLCVELSIGTRTDKDLLGSIVRVGYVLYNGPGFLSYTAWTLIPKKHSYESINQLINHINMIITLYIFKYW